MNKNSTYRFIFAGGGTGGHLYPAIAVAQQIRSEIPDAQILFVGAKNKIESKVVPQYGFEFRAIWISGFSRKFTFDNLLFPIKIIVALFQSLAIVMKYKPRVAVGSGAYVSGPVVLAASILGSKIILLEQNSYPGITNRLLEKKAEEIHLTFEESKKYFRVQSRLYVTGNPVRIDMKIIDKRQAVEKFGFNISNKVLLIVGGSGGAGSINNSVAASLDSLVELGIQIIWQTGKYYYETYKDLNSDHVKVMAFIDDMTDAYSAADLVVARSGATTIAEVSYLGMPVIFVPSTNVAANHQFLNAKALYDSNAAVMIEDKNLPDELFDKIKEIIFNKEKTAELRKNISSFAKPEAGKIIAERAIHLSKVL